MTEKKPALTALMISSVVLRPLMTAIDDRNATRTVRVSLLELTLTQVESTHRRSESAQRAGCSPKFGQP